MKKPYKLNLLFLTLMLLFSLGTFSQSEKEELKSRFSNDLTLSHQYFLNGDYEEGFDLIHPKMFNFISREQMIQGIEMMLDENIIGFKITTNPPNVTEISERFDFEGYKYYRVYYKNSMEMQVVNEDYLLNIDNIKANIENQFSQISDSIKFDSISNTIILEGVQASSIASAEINNDNWRYVEYKNDQLYILNQIFPAEVMEKLTKPER